jgi:hypothetical protein
MRFKPLSVGGLKGKQPSAAKAAVVPRDTDGPKPVPFRKLLL